MLIAFGCAETLVGSRSSDKDLSLSTGLLTATNGINRSPSRNVLNELIVDAKQRNRFHHSKDVEEFLDSYS
jgi:hypothetical protein